VVLSGEMTMLLDEGEVVLRAGDILVQRGTAHAWSNRGSEPVVMAVVILGAEPMARHKT
jgi:mannose-6-phosphate isomerase-like protein (cupin superfamily)